MLRADQRRVLAGACVAAGAAYLLPATYNYVITPIVHTFEVSDSESSFLRQVPNLASLLVIFVAGVVGPRVGERRALVAAGALMAAGCLAVAAAPSFPVVVAGLAVQATGSTVLLVVSLGAVAARVDDPAGRATAFATYSMVSPVVFVVLPVLAGLVLQDASWRWVAGLWAAGGLVAAAATSRLIPPAGGRRTRAELVTPLLAGVVCLGLAQAVSHAGTDGLVSTATAVRLAVAGGALALLTVAHRRMPRPSLSLAALRRGGVLVLLVVVALWCFTQLWYYMTITYQYVFGLSVLAAALLMVPAQLGAVAGARSAGWLVNRYGQTATGVGLLLGCGASLLLAVAVGVDSPLWLPVLATCLYSYTSVGAGVPMTNAIMDSAPPGEEGSASAFRSAAISVGTVAGITLVTALAVPVAAAALTEEFAAAGLPAAEADAIIADLRDDADSEEESAVYAVPPDDAAEVDRMEREALMAGVDAQSWSGAAVSVATAGVFWYARRRQVGGGSDR